MIEQIFGIIIAFFGVVMVIAVIKILLWQWEEYKSILLIILMSWFLIMGILISLAGVGLLIGGSK